MAINPSAVKSAVKNISGKPLEMTSKILGAATVASVIYDSHINGKERADTFDEKRTADRVFNQFKQYKTMEKESATLAKLKKIWYNMQRDFPYHHIAARSKGYSIGFGNTLLNNIPLISLAAVSLLTKKAGKVAAVLLAANGIKTLLYDVAGVGSKKNKHNF